MRIWIALSGFALLAAAGCGALAQQVSKAPSAQATSATLDRMIAAGKSPRELGQYVFDTHGCNSCHTVGQDGKLGFTAKGKQLTLGFVG
jgi:cytochrome c2